MKLVLQIDSYSNSGDGETMQIDTHLLSKLMKQCLAQYVLNSLMILRGRRGGVQKTIKVISTGFPILFWFFFKSMNSSHIINLQCFPFSQIQSFKGDRSKEKNTGIYNIVHKTGVVFLNQLGPFCVLFQKSDGSEVTRPLPVVPPHHSLPKLLSSGMLTIGFE